MNFASNDFEYKKIHQHDERGPGRMASERLPDRENEKLPGYGYPKMMGSI